MDGIYQHFRPEEAPFIDGLLEDIARAENEYRPVLTHFMDPRRQFIARTLVGRSDAVRMRSFGGYPGSERQRILFYPEYYEPQDEDLSLSLMSVKYPAKFAVLEHGSILGTLANCGLDREVIGDIITDGSEWQFFCEKEIGSYLTASIDRIGRVKVRLEPVSLQNAVTPADEWEHSSVVLSSLRCDVLISSVYNLSRKHVKDLLQAGMVSLNWMPLGKADVVAGEQDVLSVRGYGRIRLDGLAGVSRKGRTIAEVSFLKKK